MTPYVVRRGDHLVKIVTSRNLDPDEVWQHPKNATLRGKRKSMHVLCAGDIVFLPNPPPVKWLPISVGASNPFKATVPTVKITVVFSRTGKPLASESCTVDELPALGSLTTDGSGSLTFQAPVHLEHMTVTFPKYGAKYGLRVGHLDPVEEPSGVLQRLRNMGYTTRVPGGGVWRGSGPQSPDEAELFRGLLAFQAAQKLPPTGILDQATRDALAKQHGC